VISLVDGGMEAPSVNRKVACLRTFYKFLLREGHIEKDPMVRIRSLKTRKKLPGFVKESDMDRMFTTLPAESFEDVRDLLILEMFYSTGIRLSELVSLKEQDVDIRQGSIKVLGKRNKERIIPFPKSIVELIGNYRKKKALTPGSASEYLLTTSKGQRCYPAMIYRIVKKYLSQFTSVEKRSPHVLRHTYATHLLDHGAEINAVKDLLGHSSLAATQVYTHNSMEKLKQAFEKAHPKA